MALLEAVGLSKRYGGVAALVEARFDLRPGEVHALIGANGSGKSTLCKIIAGAVAPDRGVLRLQQHEIRFSGPAAAGRAGIGVFYQELSLIPQLTVAQNIFLGREPRTRVGLVDEAATRAAAQPLLERFAAVAGSDYQADRLVVDLSPDQRQITEVLKVVSRESRIVLFDEATAALDHRQVEVFFGLVRELRAVGRAVVFISHRLDEIFAIGDRITVLCDGRTVATLDVAGADRDDVVRHMVGGAGAGTPAAVAAPPRPSPTRPEPAAVLLEAEALRADRLDGVALTVRAGEIVGLGGLHGQGQSALLRGLFGALRMSGRVRLNGVQQPLGSARRALRAGFAYISGDRARDGIFPVRSVFENLVAARLSQGATLIVRPRQLHQWIDRAVAQLRTKFASYAAPVTSLSGGNQQKVVVGRWLATTPRVLLLDDPTKGIDLQAKADLYRILRELAGQGVGILFYSSDDSELLEHTDRVLVFNAGRVVAELSGARLNRFEFYRAAYGETA